MLERLSLLLQNPATEAPALLGLSSLFSTFLFVRKVQFQAQTRGEVLPSELHDPDTIAIFLFPTAEGTYNFWFLGFSPYYLINVSVCLGSLYDVFVGAGGSDHRSSDRTGQRHLGCFQFACLFIQLLFSCAWTSLHMQHFFPLMYFFLQINNQEKEDPQDQRTWAFESTQGNQPQDFGNWLRCPKFYLRALSPQLITNWSWLQWLISRNPALPRRM